MLSVMVLTLAFFVVLNSISKVEPSRSKRVLDSIDDTFGQVSGSDLVLLRGGEVAMDSAQLLQHLFRPLENLAPDLVRVQRVTANSVEIRFSSTWLFSDRSTKLGPTATKMIGEIRRLLRTLPNEWRYEMEVALTAPQPANLEFARAASLATSLSVDEASDHLAFVSVSPGTVETIAIRIGLLPSSQPKNGENRQP